MKKAGSYRLFSYHYIDLFEVSKFSLFQEFNGSLNVLVHYPVLAVERYDGTEFCQEVFQIF